MPDSVWSLPAVLDVVTDAAPDRDMLVWTSVRRSYTQVRERTRHLGAFFCAHGLGVRRERSQLERWECGQTPIAILLSNCPEYLETMIGAYRARAVPFNINHHYTPGEVAALLKEMSAEAIVYHQRLAPLLAEIPDFSGHLLVHVDDHSGVAPLDGSTPFESAIAQAAGVSDLPVPSPDDLYLVCTGGTTGAPKGVLWRQADIYVAALGGIEGTTTERIAAIAKAGAGVWFPVPPLMHAAAQWTAFSALHNGGTVVLHDDTAPFDPRLILEIAQRERVKLMSIVGDAYARPIVNELASRHYDLSSLERLGTGGAMTSPSSKHALLELLPHITVVDGYGASETGGMAFGASTKNQETRVHSLSEGAAVLSADRSRFLQPGDDEVGWTARVGRVPLGYLNDREKTTRTFPIVDGQHVTVPGDRARYTAEGRIELLGRDSLVINTGGEKVFVEEVEEVVRQHPEVVDALVVGRRNDRFGEEVVALVQVRPGSSLSPGDVRAFAAGRIARFKAPRAVLLCDAISRHPSGKADYSWARRAAQGAMPVASG